MLSNKKIICPNNLINIAKKTGIVGAAIVNAGEIFPMESVHKAVQHNLINPIFIGNETEIKKYAKKLNWDIAKYKIINEKVENNTAPIAAKLASEGKVKIIVKGHIHTDILLKAVLKRDLNLIGKKRLSHVWHMTLETDDKPFIITDGVVNVLPKLEVKCIFLEMLWTLPIKLEFPDLKFLYYPQQKKLLKVCQVQLKLILLLKKQNRKTLMQMFLVR